MSKIRITLLLTTELALIRRFNVNKCDVTDTLLPHGAAKVSSQSP